MIEKQVVEVLSNEVNAVVLKTPGRNYPGLVIQGDTLRNLYKLAERILMLTAQGETDELKQEAEDLRDQLRMLVIHYEEVLKSHNVELPYPIRNKVSG